LNFGPDAQSEVAVAKIVETICNKWGDGARFAIDPPPGAPHEAAVLRLNSEKARRELGWKPGWNLDAALRATVAWFQAFRAGEDMAAFTHQQIKAYCES
jgi:CDP-glucose 4,6-dehydratase